MLNATVRGDRPTGSKTGSVNRLPTAGDSPNATASGTIVGSRIGPDNFMRWVSTGVLPPVASMRMSSESPTTRPRATIGPASPSKVTAKAFVCSARVSTTCVRADARCVRPPTGRSATR